MLPARLHQRVTVIVLAPLLFGSLSLACDDAESLAMPDAGVSPDAALVDASAPPCPDASLDAAVSLDGGSPHASTSKILLFGGTGGGDTLGDTWLFDGKAWTQLTVPGPPARTESPVMATLGGKAVLFGGSILAAGGPLVLPDGGRGHSVLGDDTWAFDGAGWTHVAASPAPAARNDAVMALLGDKLVLFGGQSSNTAYTDTWTFDAAGFATGWVPQPTSTPPSQSLRRWRRSTASSSYSAAPMPRSEPPTRSTARPGPTCT